MRLDQNVDRRPRLPGTTVWMLLCAQVDGVLRSVAEGTRKEGP